MQACSLLVDTKSRRAAQSAADRARSQAAAAQLVKDKADAAALVKSNRKLQQERDLARAKNVRLEEDAAAAAALIDDAAVAPCMCFLRQLGHDGGGTAGDCGSA